MSDSQFDVVVFGATSFVGQILCQYLFCLLYTSPSPRD